jgi:hypothetical protein
VAPLVGLAVVDLAPDELQAALGDAVGFATLRLDRFLRLEFREEAGRQPAHPPTITVDEFELGDLATLVFGDGDIAALRECMEHALFVSGNVHLSLMPGRRVR